MTDDAELLKLSQVLGVEPARLAYLSGIPPADIRNLRLALGPLEQIEPEQLTALLDAISQAHARRHRDLVHAMRKAVPWPVRWMTRFMIDRDRK